ncbi:MAG: alpha/beta hydrolase [Alphaproteobacteria bacterium]|nr:alpha/beta hydrolase [Alphaproteobacteria bacterium]
MFDDFTTTDIATSGAVIRTVHGGAGPPLLLLHGNPLTHVMWHKVAPALAEKFTVIATDLRGYGDSSKPVGGGDHSDYSFRAMAQDQVEVMAALGHERFQVAGHDRGGRVAHRMALDHPERVARLAVLDIIPTYQLLSHVTKGWAEESYHWFFMAQPFDFPEHFLGLDLAYYIRRKLDKKGVGLGPFTADAMAEYVRCCTPENIHAVCEDYRATLGVDFEMDGADLAAGRRIACPLLVIWGENSHVGRHLDPRGTWTAWADDITFKPFPSGHYPAEQDPDLTLAAFFAFFDAGRIAAAV